MAVFKAMSTLPGAFSAGNSADPSASEDDSISSLPGSALFSRTFRSWLPGNFPDSSLRKQSFSDVTLIIYAAFEWIVKAFLAALMTARSESIAQSYIGKDLPFFFMRCIPVEESSCRCPASKKIPNRTDCSSSFINPRNKQIPRNGPPPPAIGVKILDNILHSCTFI